MSKNIVIRSSKLDAAEISWFAPLCNGDDQYLGAHDDAFKSNWKNTSEIVLEADRLGFRNILCPSSYQVGQDTSAFVSAIAPLTHNINLLAAIRCGELHPPMLAKMISTLDHILEGRLTINIISSDLPGTKVESKDRYQRSREVIEILKQAWTLEQINFKGKFYDVSLSSTDPVKPYQQNGGPLLYFGGYSPQAIDLCAEHCDVYLMWPETKEKLQGLMANMSEKAAQYNRTVDFGLRVHVIVRETEKEARYAAKELMKYVDDENGAEIRERAQDAKSLGVSRQTHMREISNDDGFVENNLWTGIGRARSGCGAALVGTPQQIISKIQEYMDLGIRAFIFSGYPHLEECANFAKLVLPHLKTCSLPEVQGRVPSKTPATPLGTAKRN